MFVNENVLESVRGTPLGAQFERAGRDMRASIPEHTRDGTVFTLDAVVDAQDRAWFLEMNSHPMVHPDTYAAMFRSSFAST